MATEAVPQTIDVTGLPPHAVRAIEGVVSAFRAQAAVTRPDRFDHPAKLPGTGPPPGETAEEWVARFRAAFDRPPEREGVVEIDDDRGSIYDRSTE